jgi:hypothetical protein
MLVAQHPLHGSVRAELPHTARASGRDDQTLVRVRVAYVRDGKPVRNQAEYATPAQMMALAAATQGAVPQPTDLEAEHAQARAVAWHAKVPAMTGHHGPQVLALLGNGSMHAPSEFQLARAEPEQSKEAERSARGRDAVACIRSLVSFAVTGETMQ